MTALLLLWAGLAAAQTAQPVVVKVTDAVVDWLKIYPLAPYREYWAMTVSTADLSKDVGRVIAVVEKRGGKLAVPLANAVSSQTSQQLTFHLDRKQAEAVLGELKKSGLSAPPLVRPAGEKAPVAELTKKIDALMRDKQDHSEELAKMPAVSALTDAALSHLVTARTITQKGLEEIVLNLTLETRPTK